MPADGFRVGTSKDRDRVLRGSATKDRGAEMFWACAQDKIK